MSNAWFQSKLSEQLSCYGCMAHLGPTYWILTDGLRSCLPDMLRAHGEFESSSRLSRTVPQFSSLEGNETRAFLDSIRGVVLIFMRSSEVGFVVMRGIGKTQTMPYTLLQLFYWGKWWPIEKGLSLSRLCPMTALRYMMCFAHAYQWAYCGVHEKFGVWVPWKVVVQFWCLLLN